MSDIHKCEENRRKKEKLLPQRFDVSYFLHNFVPMNVLKKRHIAAWLLLAVYVSMLILSSMHVHGNVATGELACDECVQHQCHGHLMQFSGDFHQCVLCQILTLSYVAAASGLFLLSLPRCKVLYAIFGQSVCLGNGRTLRLRGPPSV